MRSQLINCFNAIRKNAFHVLLFSFLSISTNVIADESNNRKSELFHEYLQLAGLYNSIERTPEKLIDGFRKELNSSTDFDLTDPNQMAFVGRVNASLEKTITIGKYKQLLNLEVNENISLSMLEEAMEFYRTPLGVKIAAMNSNSEGALSSPEFRLFMKIYPDMEKSNARLSQISELFEVKQMHKDIAAIRIDIAIANVVGLQDSLPSQFQEDFEFYVDETELTIEAIEATRLPMEATFAKFLTAYAYYAGQDLSDAEFKEYLESQQSAASMALYEAHTTAHRNFSVKSAYSVGATLGRYTSELAMSSAE